MAESTVGVVGDRVAHAEGSVPSPVRLRGLASLRGTVRVRCTAADALSNLVAVLELTAEGQMRCSAATRRPLTATMRLVQDALVAGDYYDDADLEAALTMAASQSRRSHGRCSCKPAAWRGSPGPGSS